MIAAESASLDELAEPLRAMRNQFESVLEPNRPALWEYCRRLTGTSWDAEDLVQETMMRAFANLPNLWQPVNPRAYLYRIASNAWIDQLRRERRDQLDALDATVELTDPAVLDGPVHTREALTRLVRLLPPRQRVVLLLCDTLDFRAAEVASMLGTTEGAVRAALHRARDTLANTTRMDSEPPTRLTDPTALQPIVKRYIDAFNARDPDAIAALLHEEAVVTIVGSAEEFGRAVARSSSLAEWAADPHEQWVEPAVLEGRAALLVFYRTPEHEKALAWITTLEADAGAFHSQRIYYFCPEFIRLTAARLGVPAVTHGYQYVGPQ